MSNGISITVLQNGPYLVTGPISVTDNDGSALALPEVVALCRCGQSASKPFCDGSHARSGFVGTLARDA
jgi:CDGSH-type Zn-finger protein